MPIKTGNQALAADIKDLCYLIRKTADETVNNSTALQDDDDFILPLAANEVWLVELFLLQQSPSNASDFKMGWTYPVGCTISWGSPNEVGSNTSQWEIASVGAVATVVKIQTDTLGAGTGNFTQAIHITAIVVNGANAGNLVFQWAQNTATVEDTKVLENSILKAHRLSPDLFA